MNDELDKLLCKRHPTLFRDRHAGIDRSCMSWGFCCGDGWFFLIDTLCSEIDRHTKAHGFEIVAIRRA